MSQPILMPSTELLHQQADYRLAIFDFDGTLADSFPFFASVFNQLAEQYRFNTIHLHELDHLRHATPRQIMQHVKMPAWKLPLVSREFMRLMRQNAHQIELFEGIDESLNFLAQSGMRLAIVSSNSKENIAAILGAELFALFDQVYCGMSIFGKTTPLKKLIRKSGIAARHAIYIGDQETDAEAAACAGLAFAAVTWGFSSIESLRRHPIALELNHRADVRLLSQKPTR